MTHQDQLHRYLFKEYSVRGVLSQHNQKTLCRGLLVATSLFTTTLKFTGEITVQLQGNGPLRLAVMNGDDRQNMRGLARVDGEIAADASGGRAVGVVGSGRSRIV
ncbi:MAG: 33 kDa chaperonin [Sodalis sp.]|nr:MAG: 33 kDa chaperonin [Sodalis sp.]